MNNRQWRLDTQVRGDQKRHTLPAPCPCQRRGGLSSVVIGALALAFHQVMLVLFGLTAVMKREGNGHARPTPFLMPGDLQGQRAGGEGPQARPVATDDGVVVEDLSAEMFMNPVIDRDFADPDAIKVGDTYYAYATNTRTVNVQVARSKDLVSWELLGDAMPVLPTWARARYTWAPDVTLSADGKSYVMYFVARDRASRKQVIGVSVSERPEGPFVPVGDRPLIAQIEDGGSIDPHPFVDDDGQRYLLWKNDGNCCGFDTWIYVQRISDDGLTLEGTPTRLIKADLQWEGNLVEAPIMWKRAGKYYLFYSANGFATSRYAVGYAIADNLTGPYTKSQVPLLNTDHKVHRAAGPGGQDIVVGHGGETWMLYHTWDPKRKYRNMNIDVLAWEDEKPVVKRAGHAPQRKPGARG